MNFISETNVKVLWTYLSSYYHFLSDDQKASIETYWKALLDGFEAFYYNLSEAAVTSSILYSKGYIEDMMKEFTTTLSKLSTIPFSNVKFTEAIVGIANGTDYNYEYYITGVQTLNSVTYETAAIDRALVACGSTFSNTLKWVPIEGVSTYKIYRHKIGNPWIDVITTTQSGSYIDTGTFSERVKHLPTENTTIKYYAYPLDSKYKHLYISNIISKSTGTQLVPGADFDILTYDTLAIKPSNNLKDTDTYIINLELKLAPIFETLFLKIFGYDLDVVDFLDTNCYYSYIYSDTLENSIRNRCTHLVKLFNAIFQTLKYGLSMTNLKKLFEYYYNVPFAYEDGTISSISNVPSGQQIVFEDSTVLVVPASLHLLKKAGDSVKKFELLADEIQIGDYINSPVTISNIVTGYDYYFTIAVLKNTSVSDLHYYNKYVDDQMFKEHFPPGTKIKYILNSDRATDVTYTDNFDNYTTGINQQFASKWSRVDTQLNTIYSISPIADQSNDYVFRLSSNSGNDLKIAKYNVNKCLNCQVQFDISAVYTNNQSFGIGVRGTKGTYGEDFIWVYFDTYDGTGKLKVASVINSEIETVINSVPLSIAPNTVYSLKIDITDSVLKVKTWVSTNTEPDWLFTIAIDKPVAGDVLLASRGNNLGTGASLINLDYIYIKQYIQELI